MTKISLGPKPYAVPTPLWIIGTYDKEGNPDAMAAAWAGIANSEPPCVFVALRGSRKTYENLLETRSFTVCIPPTSYAAEADYFGIESGHDADKFEKAGLTAEKANTVNAPYIREFPVHLECRLFDRMTMGSHVIVIGRIEDVVADEAVLNENGQPDIEKIDPVVFAPDIQQYFGIGKNVGKAFQIGKEIKKAEE